MNDKRYHTPFQNLHEESKKDVEFFKLQLRNFQIMIAVRAFSDLKTCRTLGDTINTLKELIKDCEKKQVALERMANREYKAYLAKLCRDIKNPYSEEEPAGVTDTEPEHAERKAPWLAKG